MSEHIWEEPILIHLNKQIQVLIGTQKNHRNSHGIR